MDERMRDRVEAAIKSVDAQYIEVHIEEAVSSNIRYRGRELEEIGRGNGLGGSVRALAGGGWGFVSFNDLSDLDAKVRMAVAQAKVVGGERIELAEVPTVVDFVPARVGLDPGGVTLTDKKATLDQYVEIMMGTAGVQSASVGYTDARRHMIFANSEGSYIDQSRVDINMRLAAMARDGSEVQQSGKSLGSLGD